MPHAPITRRSFVAGATAAFATATCRLHPATAAQDELVAHQATGTRVGEMTSDSAVIWTRLTAHPTRNNDGLKITQHVNGQEASLAVDDLEGACPGAAGWVRLRYGAREDLRDAVTTEWMKVAEADDFIHQFRLTGLKPATVYYYASDTANADRSQVHVPARGQFQTAPPVDVSSDVSFCVMTCQGYPDRGHPDGHAIYPSMLALQPQFTILTGDLVYYDNDPPRAMTPRLARYHWERMFSLPRLLEFNRRVGTYWLKDDHDTLDDDSWPGEAMGTLTFAEGQRIFRQQAPMGDSPSYRTFRWGRDLQMWLTEGRDFRSPNRQSDGPGKTIWGREQKAWFKRTVSESDATWKVLISPTPLVGPDRKKKNDNHANEGFRHEGDELREWLKEHAPENFFVICGDRHWQYHSVHPQTGLNEFSVGAASDQHAGGSPGENKAFHKFHRIKGGFLSVVADTKHISFRHRDVSGKEVYRFDVNVG